MTSYTDRERLDAIINHFDIDDAGQYEEAVNNPGKFLLALLQQRDELLDALRLAMPLIEREKFKADGAYGKNYVQTKSEAARVLYDSARAAITKTTG